MEKVFELILSNLIIIIPTIAGFLLGVPFIVKANGVIKELGEFIVVYSKAVADGKITKEEAEEIAKEGKDIITAFKNIKIKK